MTLKTVIRRYKLLEYHFGTLATINGQTQVDPSSVETVQELERLSQTRIREIELEKNKKFLYLKIRRFEAVSSLEYFIKHAEVRELKD